MQDIFVELVLNKNKWWYECNGKKVTYNNEPTEHEHGKYLVVVCDKCCNTPVMHLLRKESNG